MDHQSICVNLLRELQPAVRIFVVQKLTTCWLIAMVISRCENLGDGTVWDAELLADFPSWCGWIFMDTDENVLLHFISCWCNRAPTSWPILDDCSRFNKFTPPIPQSSHWWWFFFMLSRKKRAFDNCCMQLPMRPASKPFLPHFSVHSLRIAHKDEAACKTEFR